MRVTSVRWAFDPDTGTNEATLSALGDVFHGRVIAARQHDGGIKVNMVFSGEGSLEIIDVVAVKSRFVSGVGLVGSAVRHGEKLVSVILGFQDAACEVDWALGTPTSPSGSP